MKIALKSLTIKNFRGIKSQLISFDLGVTNIFGANGSGKSTVMDAFLWLVFGKDSQDRKDHLIKTIDQDGVVIPKLEHEVSAILLIDNKEVVLSKTYKEKWVKKQGAKVAEMTGHEKTHLWNDVPLSETEYKAKIDSFLNESVFKLITNVNQFNSIPWQERRSALFSLAGKVENADVIKQMVAGGVSLKGLASALDAGKSVSEFKKEISAGKKRLKAEIEAIPIRIDEIYISMPELDDYAALRAELATGEAEVQRIDYILRSESKKRKEQHDQQSAQADLLNSKKNQLKAIEYQEMADKQRVESGRQLGKQRIESKITNLQEKGEQLASTMKSRQGKVDALEAEIVATRAELKSRAAEVLEFDQDAFNCPVCLREFDGDKKEDIEATLDANFKLKRAKDLAEIQGRGKLLAQEITDGKAAIESIDVAIAQYNNEIVTLNTIQPATEENIAPKQSIPEYQLLLSQIESLEKYHIIEFEELTDTALDTTKKSLSIRGDEIKAILLNEQLLIDLDARVKELEAKQDGFSNQLNALEGEEFTIEEFTKTMISMVEDKINGMFSKVTFQMFKKNVNLGIEETCETLLKGTNYSVLNTAGKMEAGLDIIGAFMKFYDVSGPIFLDNRESVTFIPDVDSQVINLIVSPTDTKLRIA